MGSVNVTKRATAWWGGAFSALRGREESLFPLARTARAHGSGSSWSPSRDRYTNASVPKPSMDMSVRSPPKYRA